MVPFGSVASELWALLGPPVVQRRDDWLIDLERRLRELEGQVKGFRFDDLGQNQQFVSAALVATQAALRTHQQEKLSALKNAVANVALGNEQDADRQQQFLALVDRFTATHLVLLHFFKDPAGYCKAEGKAVPNVPLSPQKLKVYDLIRGAMPKLVEAAKSTFADRTAAAFQFIELVLRDLVSAKLIALDPLNETWSVPKFNGDPRPTPVKPLITHLGEDFLSFITEPDAK